MHRHAAKTTKINFSSFPFRCLRVSETRLPFGIYSRPSDEGSVPLDAVACSVSHCASRVVRFVWWFRAYLMRRRMSGEWVVCDGRLHASASNCRLAPIVSLRIKIGLCECRVPVLPTYLEGMLPLVAISSSSPPRVGGGRRSTACVPIKPHLAVRL